MEFDARNKEIEELRAAGKLVFCMACGEPNSTDDAFCGKCGARIASHRARRAKTIKPRRARLIKVRRDKATGTPAPIINPNHLITAIIIMQMPVQVTN